MSSRAAAVEVSAYDGSAAVGLNNVHGGTQARTHHQIARARYEQVATIKNLIDEENEGLLQHRYFDLCRRGALSRGQLIALMKELYCFSIFYERILTMRVARYSSGMDGRALEVARQHLEEEIGHVRMFKTCLLESGVPADEVARVAPKALTKALYGYLLATVLHESDHVINVAVTLVMESIGYHFFRATSTVMSLHRLVNTAAEEHAAEDAGHAALGIELAAYFDDPTMHDSRRVISDIYRLMPIVLDEWLTTEKAANAGSA